jgi:FkbM family methyltransferase
MKESQRPLDFYAELNSILIEARNITALFEPKKGINGAQEKSIFFWGIGNRFSAILEFWNANKFVNPISAIDSTREVDLNSIPDIRIEPFANIYNYDPNKTIIVITAGLLDLQAKVINKELYYYKIIHIRSLEMATYLIKNFNQFEFTLGKLSSNESKKLYLDLLSNIIGGRFFDPTLHNPDSYFGNTYIKCLDQGTILFAGAFNGKHIVRFLEDSKDINILAFEPNPDWYKTTLGKFSSESRVSLKNTLLGSIESQVFFDPDTENHGLSARIEQQRSDKTILLSVSKLDDEFFAIPNHGSVSQIILDVEGAEPDTLNGSSQIIKSFHPKLSICIYHNPHDFSNMIRIIEDISPNRYRYEILQHSCISNIETVLYCLPISSQS